MKTATKKAVKFAVYIIIVLLAYIAGAKTGSEIGIRQTVVKQELTQPNMTATELAVWANDAAVDILTTNYVDYERQLQEAAKYFTPDGWKIYMDALQQSKLLDQIIKEKLIISAVATGAPKVMVEGLHDRGVYSWKITIPMLVTYHNAAGEKQQNLTIALLIIRTPKYIGKHGVGILEFNSK